MGGKCATGSVNGTLLSMPNVTGYEPAQSDPKLYKMYSKHLPAKKIRDMVGIEKWNEYFKFTFVRNTYSWVTSSFFFMVKIRKLKMPPDGIMTMKNFQQVVDYYQSDVGRRHDRSYPIRSQKIFISDTEGNVIVDYFGRLESLQKDFDYVCNRLGLPQRGLPLCNISQSSQSDWRENYRRNPEAKELVYHKWKIDIDYFDFKLE
jgi:hypothetical protein